MLGQGSSSCHRGAISPGTRALVDILPLIRGNMMNWLFIPELSAILLLHPSM